MGGHYERGLYKQLEEQIAANEKLREDAHRRELCLQSDNRLEKERLANIIKEQSALITGLSQTIEKNNALIEKLLEEIERLKSIIDKDSHNSSLPPSGDRKPKKANEYNSRTKSERKQGGQKGHEGKTLKKSDIEAMLASGECRHEIKEHGKRGNAKRYTVKYEVDVRVDTVVIEHRFYEDEHGKIMIPAEYYGDVRYGSTLGAIAGSLYSVGVVSIERIRDFLCSICQDKLRISSGWIYGSIQRLSERLNTSVIAEIQQELQSKRLLHTDATCIKVDGTTGYIRNISSSDSVLYTYMEKKTLEEMRKLPVLGTYCGTLVHDHETALYHFGTRHAECNVHLLRYLIKNTEDTGHIWSAEMKKFLTEMNTDRKKRIESQSPYSDEELTKYEMKYRRILAQGQAENETCKPQWAKKEERSLLNRMEKYKESHLLFLYDFGVPFDNNLSERDLRKCKNRQKMSGGFRSADGAEMFSLILSAVETWKRRHQNVFAGFVRLLSRSSALIEG